MIRFNCPNCGRPHEVFPALAKLPLVCKGCGQRITPVEVAPAPAPPPPAPVPPPAPPSAPAAPGIAPKPAPPVPKIAPEKPTAPKPAPVAKAPAPEKPTAKTLPAPPEDDKADVLVTKADSSPDIDFDVGGPTAASLSEANRARPAGLSDATRPRPAELDAAAGACSDPEINLDLLPKAVPAQPPKPAPTPAPEPPPDRKPEATLLPFVADAVVFVLLVLGGMFLGEQLAQKPTGQVLTEAGSSPKFPPLDLLLWGGPPLMFALVYLLLNSRELTVGAWIRRRRARTSANRDR